MVQVKARGEMTQRTKRREQFGQSPEGKSWSYEATDSEEVTMFGWGPDK